MPRFLHWSLLVRTAETRFIFSDGLGCLRACLPLLHRSLESSIVLFICTDVSEGSRQSIYAEVERPRITFAEGCNIRRNILVSLVAVGGGDLSPFGAHLKPRLTERLREPRGASEFSSRFSRVLHHVEELWYKGSFSLQHFDCLQSRKPECPELEVFSVGFGPQWGCLH